ncbi:MAG: phosphate signaling complex protein PhoU [Bacteroidota bacterium]
MLAPADQTLQNLFAGMFDLVGDQIADALTAMQDADDVLSQKVLAQDDLVDSLEMKIDKQCAAALASGHDGEALRYFIAAIKVNTDLERIGDHAKNLAKVLGQSAGLPANVRHMLVEDVGEPARTVFHQAQQAFSEPDVKLAWSIVENDKQVNRRYKSFLQETLTFYEAQGMSADVLASLLRMTRSIERIADHAVNIAESTIYWLEGLDVRHRGLRRSDAHPG